ncbi:hypothetical protein DRP98_09215, partial [candidate division KSB1 bacterium]
MNPLSSEANPRQVNITWRIPISRTLDLGVILMHRIVADHIFISVLNYPGITAIAGAKKFHYQTRAGILHHKDTGAQAVILLDTSRIYPVSFGNGLIPLLIRLLDAIAKLLPVRIHLPEALVRLQTIPTHNHYPVP